MAALFRARQEAVISAPGEPPDREGICAVAKKDVFETIDGTASARTESKGRTPRRRCGGIAVCLCLLIGGALCCALWGNGRDRPDAARGGGADSGGGALIGEDGPAPGGSWENLPEGMDPITASIASFPAGESLENVAAAEVISLTEAEAADLEGIGAHLPAVLPDGYFFGWANLYETTMKDGTVYRHLMVSCNDTVPPEPVYTEDGGQAAPSPEELGESFRLGIWAYRPDTDRPFCDPAALTAADIDAMPGLFYLDCGDWFAVVEPLGQSGEEMLAVIRSMGGQAAFRPQC